MKPKPRLLAIDTLSASCTVAILDSDGAIHTRRGSGSRRHARQVLSLVDAVLGDSGLSLTELSALAVISGPGSFTGLRIGMTVAQGLAFSVGLPVIPVSSLALLAGAAPAGLSPERLLCVRGARPAEYYHAIYQIEHGLPRLQGKERVGPFPPTVPARPYTVLTDAVTASALQVDLLAADAEAIVVDADAATLARLSVRLWEDEPSASISPAQAVPVYIKDDLEYRKSGAPGS